MTDRYDAEAEADRLVEIMQPPIPEWVRENVRVEARAALSRAREAALEEAAALCEYLLSKGWSPPECAHRIRALAAGEDKGRG